MLTASKDVSSEDRLRFGQTLRSQGDLLRLNGQLTSAKPVYDHAENILNQALAVKPKQIEIRNELALAVEARGWINRELGELKAAGQDYRHSLDLLEKLVAEIPTAPRYRESLAKTCNSLGLLEETTGSLVEAETFYRRELPLVERLSQDFPDRPEHARELARTLWNLGNILARNRDGGAEAILGRAVVMNRSLNKEHPEDVQIRFDLCRAHQCLGDLQFEQGKLETAVASIRDSRCSVSPWSKSFQPIRDTPTFSHRISLNSVFFCTHSTNLNRKRRSRNLRRFTRSSSRPIQTTLITRSARQAVFVIKGTVIASLGHAEEAESIYRKALTLFDAHDAKAQTTEVHSSAGGVIEQLWAISIVRVRKRPSVTRSRSRPAFLSARPRPTKIFIIDRSPRITWPKFSSPRKNSAEAESVYAQAVAGFEKLVANAPNAIDFQSHFGIVLSQQAKFLAQSGKLSEGKASLENAIDHQQQAVKLARGNSDPYRQYLGAHQFDLADVQLKLGAYEHAARIAIEIPKSVPASGRTEGCFDAARILARLLTKLSADEKLVQAERERLTRRYLGRTVILLREVIDTDPKLAEQIKTDADIKLLQSRPEFQTMMNMLVNVQP